MDSTELYRTTTTTTYAEPAADSNALIAMVAGLGIGFMLISLLIGVATLVGMWKVYTKAGQPGWKAIIPVYSNWVFLQLGKQPGWWAILAFVPIVNIASIVFMIIAASNISKSLGKPGAFAILYFFLAPIWAIWLGFDKSTWEGKGEKSAATPTDTPAFVPPTADTVATAAPETKPPIQ